MTLAPPASPPAEPPPVEPPPTAPSPSAPVGGRVAAVFALLAAIGAGVLFLPNLAQAGLGGYGYRSAMTIVVLLMPSLGVCTMLAALSLGGKPLFRVGGGYLLVALGALISLALLETVSQNRGPGAFSYGWLLLHAVAGGIALGGLMLVAATGSDWERLAIGFGLPVSTTAYTTVIWLLRPVSLNTSTAYVIPAVITVSALLAAALTWRRSAATGKGLIGAALVVVVAAVLVMGGARVTSELIFPSSLPYPEGPPSEATATLIMLIEVTLVLAVGALLVWYAARLGRTGLARFALLGVALAPLLILRQLSLMIGSMATPGIWQIGMIGAALLGVAAGFWGGRRVGWEAIGVLVATAGLLSGYQLEEASATTPLGLLMVGGLTFALSAGIVRTASLPHGAIGLVLGFAAMLLGAQAIGTLPVEAMMHEGGSPVVYAAPAVSIVAALAILVVTWRARRADNPSE